jgi:hypothetical protein
LFKRIDYSTVFRTGGISVYYPARFCFLRREIADGAIVYRSVQKNFYFASLRVIRRGGTAGEEIPFFGEPPFCQILLRCNGSSKAPFAFLLTLNF